MSKNYSLRNYIMNFNTCFFRDLFVYFIQRKLSSIILQSHSVSIFIQYITSAKSNSRTIPLWRFTGPPTFLCIVHKNAHNRGFLVFTMCIIGVLDLFCALWSDTRTGFGGSIRILLVFKIGYVSGGEP